MGCGPVFGSIYLPLGPELEHLEHDAFLRLA